MLLAGCDDGFRALADQVIDDGQVVRRQSQSTLTSCWNRPRLTRVES